MSNTLNDLYFKYGYLKFEDFINISKNYGFSEEEAKNFALSKPRYSLASKRVRPKRLRYTTLKVPGSYMMDLVFFQGKDGPPFLFIINVVSRKIWIYPLENKGFIAFVSAFNRFYYQEKVFKVVVNDIEILDGQLNDARFIGSIICDQESAFTTNVFQEFCKNAHIKLHFKDPDEHNIMGILDRAVRTIKDLLYFRASDEDASKFINTQEQFNQTVMKVVKDYNNTPHSGIKGYTPNELFADMDLQLKFLRESRIYNRNLKRKKADETLKVGDTVRVMDRTTSKLDKSHRLSDEVYTIKRKNPFSYEVDTKDEYGRVITKRLKDYEILPTKNPLPSYGKLNEKYFRSIGRQIQEYNKDPDYVPEDNPPVVEAGNVPVYEAPQYAPPNVNVPLSAPQQEIQDIKDNNDMLNVVKRTYETRSRRNIRPPSRYRTDEYYAAGRLW